MRKTQAKSFDVAVLWNRIGVSDEELAFMLGAGLPTARQVALEANAVFRVGKRKLNNVSKVKAYVDSVSGR